MDDDEMLDIIARYNFTIAPLVTDVDPDKYTCRRSGWAVYSFMGNPIHLTNDISTNGLVDVVRIAYEKMLLRGIGNVNNKDGD